MTSSIWKTAGAVVVLAASGSFAAHEVNAQTSGTTGTTGTAGSVTAARPAQSQLSAAEQANVADAIVARGSTLSTRVGQMLDDARREADMIRVTCLNDKLTQINANLRTAQTRLTSLSRALDADQRNHELTVLTVLGQKLQTLDQESNQCVGQDLYDTGPTKVVTEIDTSRLPATETDPTNPTILTPTAPSMVGVMASSPDGSP
jgi:hypothetical protein